MEQGKQKTRSEVIRLSVTRVELVTILLGLALVEVQISESGYPLEIQFKIDDVVEGLLERLAFKSRG